MQLNKIIQRNYTSFSLDYQIKLPLDLEISIPSDDPVRLVSAFVEEMDLSELYKTYGRIRKNQATPRQMLKLVIYAAMNRIYSSRDIRKAWKRAITKNQARLYTKLTSFVDECEELYGIRTVYHDQISIHTLKRLCRSRGWACCRIFSDWSDILSEVCLVRRAQASCCSRGFRQSLRRWSDMLLYSWRASFLWTMYQVLLYVPECAAVFWVCRIAFRLL